MKSLADRFELSCRYERVSYTHHEVVSSLKKLDRSEDKDWKLSNETDTEKIQALLKKAEKEKLSVRELRNIVQEHKTNQNREIALANE